MENVKVNNGKTAGACHICGFQGNKIVHQHHITKRGAGRKPSLFRQVLDFVLHPLWIRLPRQSGRLVFHVLGYALGGGRLYGFIGASSIRFLAVKERQVHESA